MSSRSMTWRRVGVGAVAAATVAAGTPLLIGTANAAPPQRLTITQDNQRTTAAAGTCTAFTVAATDFAGGPADAATITVTITESPDSDTHDVDFCVIDNGTPFRTAPQYTNANQIGLSPAAASTQQYNPGPSITTQPSDSSAPPAGSAAATTNNPDGPSGIDPLTTNSAGNPPNNNNPSGRDTASFSGNLVRFGVVGLQAGTAATINAFVDTNGNLTRQDDETVVAPTRSVSFTAGGRPGTPEASNAVTNVNILEESTRAAKSSSGGAAEHSFAVELRNDRGDLVGGVNTVRIVPVSGPNAPTSTSGGTFTSSCTASGNEGQTAACSYRPTQAGTDTVRAFVNRSGGTFDFDSNEASDLATAVTTAPAVPASQARTLVLEPDAATIAAGSSRVFTVTVTDVNGAPATRVAVTVFENGPGALAAPDSSVGQSTSRNVTTNGVGQATVTFAASTTDSGGNTLTAAIATTGTQCNAAASGTTPAGQCSDTSAITITAASPSATPTATMSPSPTASTSATPTTTASPTPTTPTTAEGSRYRGLGSPVRVLDTRNGTGTTQGRKTNEIVLDLSQRITDPNATSAVLNVTVTNATRRGFLVAYPTGTDKPRTSNVNFEENQTQANEVVVRLGSNRRVSLFVDSSTAHVIADLVGAFTASTGTGVGEITTNAPRRAFDSRDTGSPTRTGEVTVDLSSFLPTGATDAILNVTVTRTSARGFVTVFPTGTTRPGTSNVNFERGQTQANEVITRVGTGGNAGTVSFFIDSASSALIVDVVGAVTPGTEGQAFQALSSPQRVLDTRDNRGRPRTGTIDLALPSSIPSDATGVILNVTATNGTRPGFVTVYPFGVQNPGTSNVNFPTNITQANEVTTGLGDGNRVTLFVGGAGSPAAHVIVDVVGYLR